MLQVPSGDSLMNNKLRGLTTPLIVTSRITHHIGFAREHENNGYFHCMGEKVHKSFSKTLGTRQQIPYPFNFFFIYFVAYRIETIVKRPSRLHSNRHELTETVQTETNSIKPAITAEFIMIGKERK